MRINGLFRALARFAVVVAVVGACVLAGAFKFGGEQAWWAELVRFAPYPVYLLPALVALGLSMWLGWRWRVVAVIAVVLVLTVNMGLELHKGDAGSGRFRLMTYNAKAYLAAQQRGGVESIAWEVALHDPDILVMQDAERLLQPPISTLEPVRAMFRGRQVFESGQYIVASRMPLRGCTDGDISFVGEQHHYVRCVVTVHGIEIDLATAHLLSPREGLNATRHERLGGIDEWKENFSNRLSQARALAGDLGRLMGATGRPTILAGDLNAREDSPVVGMLRATGLRDAFSSAGTGYGYTHGHSLRPHISFNRIDHILVSPTLGVSDCFVGSDKPSEHRAVIADLLVKRD